MQAVLLAAGRGKRLGRLTDSLPKPLVRVGTRPLVEHVLGGLPDIIREVIVVCGYGGEALAEHLGSDHRGRDISYVDMARPLGTAAALHLARPRLRPGRFLVINADDIHARGELSALLLVPRAMGVAPARAAGSAIHILVDERGRITGGRAVMLPASPEVRVVSGAYVLDHRIFDYPPVRLESGEHGLPQTVLRMAQDVPVHAVPTPSWRSVTYPEDVTRIGAELAA